MYDKLIRQVLPRVSFLLWLNEGHFSDLRSTYDMGEHCIHPYAYKVYGDPQQRVFVDFEVGSMGVEWLYRDVSAFERDPEHLEHVLKLLREVQ